ncbi:uncharacterized protein N0V89_007125 [Didymosphaeria variabile]|uniref:Copper transport protein n=1 Tax=Didymosphaeria variabile TaxID=1932322 RepID=A0A9W8XJ23_9PLEO|nr:uncharacterized protein N0V89_007125 [Didymosphaeria variabile]KAJ4351782.1 hypothetical protein N0V89_007125 [Didymosphaeria variabile]
MDPENRPSIGTAGTSFEMFTDWALRSSTSYGITIVLLFTLGLLGRFLGVVKFQLERLWKTTERKTIGHEDYVGLHDVANGEAQPLRPDGSLVTNEKRNFVGHFWVADEGRNVKEDGIRALLEFARAIIAYILVISNPALNFVVIVNPNSGPGSEPWWPNADYIREIPKLNAQPNVRTVGYVSTAYCKRTIEEVFTDIDRYATWAVEDGVLDLGINGIFFDETPNIFTNEVKDYLGAITRKVKESKQRLGDRLVCSSVPVKVDG